MWHLLESSTYFKVKEMDTILGKGKEPYSWKGELYYILSKWVIFHCLLQKWNKRRYLTLSKPTIWKYLNIIYYGHIFYFWLSFVIYMSTIFSLFLYLYICSICFLVLWVPNTMQNLRKNWWASSKKSISKDRQIRKTDIRETL